MRKGGECRIRLRRLRFHNPLRIVHSQAHEQRFPRLRQRDMRGLKAALVARARAGPVASRVDAPVQLQQVCCEVLLVRLHGDPIDSRRCAPSLSIERSPERILIDVVQRGGEPRLGSASRRCVHPRKPRLQGDPALCRALAHLRKCPSGPPLSSTGLVSFGGLIGTTSESDSRP